VDLTRADLGGALLAQADLSYANLRGAISSKAGLYKVDACSWVVGYLGQSLEYPA
jgi:uncharacterized protein YjbI with pentapeptide repeats